MANIAYRQSEAYIEFLEKQLADLESHHSLHHSNCQFPLAAPSQAAQSSVVDHDENATPVPGGALHSSPNSDSGNGRLTRDSDLQFIQEYGCPQTSPRRKRRKIENAAVKVDDFKWRRVATGLVESIPRHQNWKNILRHCGIYRHLREGKLVANLLDGTTLAQAHTDKRKEMPCLESDSDTPIGRVLSYAKAAANTENFAQVAISFAYFQQFLVLSAGAVLLRCGKASTAEVYEACKVCIKNEVSEDYCRQILQTARFINELLDCLSSSSFGHHAGELLLICKRVNLSRALTLIEEQGSDPYRHSSS